MPSDILIAIAILFIVTMGIFFVTLRVTRGWDRKHLTILGAVASTAIAIFETCLLDSPRLLWLLPFTSTIVLGNWLMPLAAILAAVAYRSLAIPGWRKSIVSIGVMGIAGIITFRPIIAPKPQIWDKWRRDVCLQTTRATCTAAAEATLLKIHGIDASEQEMADLSLTTQRGTLFHGAFRGLTKKTESTGLKVRAVACSLEELETIGQPILVRVGIRRWQNDVDPRYAGEWGWTPGVTHSVVLLKFHDGKVDVADPSIGHETWSIENLRVLWHGIGLTIDR